MKKKNTLMNERVVTKKILVVATIIGISPIVISIITGSLFSFDFVQIITTFLPMPFLILLLSEAWSRKKRKQDFRFKDYQLLIERVIVIPCLNFIKMIKNMHPSLKKTIIYFGVTYFLLIMVGDLLLFFRELFASEYIYSVKIEYFLRLMLIIKLATACLAVLIVVYFQYKYIPRIGLEKTIDNLYELHNKGKIDLKFKHIQGKRLIDDVDSVLEQLEEINHEKMYLEVKFCYKFLKNADVLPEQYNKSLFSYKLNSSPQRKDEHNPLDTKDINDNGTSYSST
ncbi:hypothetical protein V1503_24050 [Bacillus sp. SCS-151]|uniref:hypothetical protein n=1 Tax=Nanhaiella sioensis TaxID=3115293 RepID=UPI00397C0631